MRILLVGASGTIGKKIAVELGGRHELLTAGRTSGAFRVDITDPASIEALYEQTGPVDAVISASGSGYFNTLATARDADFRRGINSKLMGQVNLVLYGQEVVRDGGSFTLTSGVLADDPVRNGANLSLINSAINGFVLGASIDLPRGLRINAVSPGVVEDSPDLFPAFPGHVPVPMNRVVAAYVKSVEGPFTGQVIRVY